MISVVQTYWLRGCPSSRYIGQALNKHTYKHKTFVSHLYNVGPTFKTLGRRCTNVIQMFCVCWASMTVGYFPKISLRAVNVRMDVKDKSQRVNSIRFWHDGALTIQTEYKINVLTCKDKMHYMLT